MKKVTIILHEQNGSQFVNAIFVGEFDLEKIERIKAPFDKVETTERAFYFTKELHNRGENFVRWLVDFVENEILEKENTMKIEEKIWEKGNLKRWELDLWQISNS